ncbi:nucleotidyltransferase domain-containing protein [Syntrophus aciditrophicus]|uniref:Hypothetical cytosolic protein n=1 Tax=Syntrophus aciditrophicus (strain SB) TaxID=56780 RepID=Q2LR08_SYNAS|nr:nucleotidyltransferase domain-containing protein [Syntrophus aciditrophicus]ABC76519.1 hypothetical cytosolic protein [Syntrophus aciditrophicus SB]OPY18319.1 MAG: hypothetical protein A4E74_00640 [Syntrophus sp. PtaB.Bin075]
MARIPKNPEEIFPEITEDYRQIFGDSLVSIILYGSGASDDYRPGISDLNFLLILDDAGLENLERAISPAKKWKSRKVDAPLIMTQSDMNSSLDSYPVEFLNMKNSYLLVYGEDVLQSLSFDLEALRLQIERELKGKLFLLRKSYLDTEGKEGTLRRLVAKSLTAFTALFEALLYLRGREIPSSRRGVIKAMAWAFPIIDPEVFLRCADIREGEDHCSASELDRLVKSCMKEIGKLCDSVDRL